MTEPVLVDTGPIVAIFSRRDRFHRACVEQLRDLPTPLLTCWPVLTEATWLLRGRAGALRRLLRAFDAGLFRLLPLSQDAIAPLGEFLHKYRNLEAQLADAALVYLADEANLDTIFTVDRRDFSVYRGRANRAFRLLPAP